MILLAVFAFAMTSCKKDSSGLFGSSDSAILEYSEEIKTEDIISVMKSPENLSLEEIAEIAGVKADAIQVSKDYGAIRPSERRLLFSWPNGSFSKITDLDGEEFEIEAYSSLGLGGVKKMSEEEFREKHESGDYNRQMIENMAEEGKVHEDIVMEEAQNLVEIEKDQQFEKIDGIGESAYWETPINALHVLADGTSFTVTTNLGEDKKSRQKAVNFLNLVLNN